jgi:hypothetical protein
MGIERIAMLNYQIGDIRMFYENDVRFLEQFKRNYIELVPKTLRKTKRHYYS